MGSEDFYPEERPVHRVSVDGFWIDEHPVTNAAFRRFVAATGYRTVAERPPNPADYPDADPVLLVPGAPVFRRPLGRVSLHAIAELLGREKYLSLMIEAGSKVNWSALESGVADKIFFYYAPKILGGMQSLPVAGGTGRMRRADAIRFRDVKLHSITSSEFAVEARLEK